jgi:hypothetical protein
VARYSTEYLLDVHDVTGLRTRWEYVYHASTS